MDRTDVELIQSILGGDKSAFPVLLERYMSSVYKFAYRYVRDPADAEDVTQEAFVRAWKNLEKFDPSRNFKTWLFTIARNAALDLIKKKKPLVFSRIGDGEGELDSFLAPYVNDPELPDALFDRSALKANMQNALASLPLAYRTVLAMRYNENLKFREIAEALGEPIDTVKSKHRRGLILLRKVFREEPPASSLA
jgi:RNA polymerase sigma-70 factor (ECF subfamily)